MFVYIAIFLIPLLFYFSKPKYQRSSKFLISFFIFLGLFVGLGDMLGGYDRYIYGELFDSLADDINFEYKISDSDIFQSYGTEQGYIWLNWLIAHFTRNRYIFILLYTLLMYGITFFNFKKYTKSYNFALILFMALVFYFSFTYLRQMMAATIAAFSYRYIINKNFWKYCAVMLLAFSFHNSAIIFFPIYFIAHRKIPSSAIIMLMAICFIVGISGLTIGLYDTYGEMSDRATHANYNAVGSTRFAYILEAFFFLYYLLKAHKYIPNDKQSIVLYNIALSFCAVLLLFIRSENGGRLSWYFVYGLIFSLTQIATSRFGKRIKMDIVLGMVSFVLFLRLTMQWAFNMTPYKTFLTPGHTADEWIYQKYEYDTSYDINKFYR